MVVSKRKKNTRQHGSKTHGWGSMKKHRGAGHRGGRGNAGTGKKADAKKPSIWSNKKYFGKHGFKSKSRIVIKSVTLQYLDEFAEKYLNAGIFSMKGDLIDVDVKKIGFNKVVGSGKITRKLNVSADYFTKLAITKIEKVGGKANLPKKDKSMLNTADKSSKNEKEEVKV